VELTAVLVLQVVQEKGRRERKTIQRGVEKRR
jgi:hypothetical protein